MTTTAHGARRVWGGATRKPGGVAGPRSELYGELHPEMFVEIPSSRPAKSKPPRKRRSPGASDNAIRDYLEQGDATATQIATSLGLTYNSVYMCLLRGLDGVERKGTTMKRGAIVQLWGVQDIHTDDSDE